jgi:hypothetical protein
MAWVSRFAEERMPPDYPAAHSMDTDWFAVDECGHVALCTSGEAGAVPEAAVQLDPDEPSQWFIPPVPVPGKEIPMPFEDCEASYFDLVARMFEGIHGVRYPDTETDVFAYRPHPGLIARLRTVGLVREYAKDRVLIRLKPGPDKERLHDYIHEQGLCLCCGTLWWSNEGPRQFSDGTTTFLYSHSSGWAIPYLLKHVPTRAAVVGNAELPAAVQREMSKASVRGCFRNRLFWQPAETMKCQIYGGSAEALRPHGTQFENSLRDYF